MVGWLTHLVYDQGGMILASNVPGAFPGCSRVRMCEAIVELVPELLPVFDITYGHGGLMSWASFFNFRLATAWGKAILYAACFLPS